MSGAAGQSDVASTEAAVRLAGPGVSTDPASRFPVPGVSTDPAGEAVLKAPVRARSEWARAKDTEGVVCQTHVGGQALIEGVMMRGTYNWAVAVREPSGLLYVEEHDLASGKAKNRWLHRPVVRGCTALVESLALGYRALEIASQHAFGFDEEEGEDVGSTPPEQPQPEADAPPGPSGSQPAPQPPPAAAAPPGPPPASQLPPQAPAPPQPQAADAIPKPVMTATMILGVLLGVGLFVVLPALVTNLIIGDYGEKTLLWNIVDGVLRIAVFVFYIWLIGRMKDIKRMFGYHGAEHKTIHCYEHGLDLTVENARRFPTLHVRCGTAFLLTTMLIAILVFTVVPIGPLIDALGVTNGALRLVLVICSRIVLLPVIAGLSYEVTVKWAGAHPESPLVQFVLWPGLQMQRLTTNQPDDGMLEVAIASMRQVLEREEREHAAKQVRAEGASAPEGPAGRPAAEQAGPGRPSAPDERGGAEASRPAGADAAKQAGTDAARQADAEGT
ncbi:MAG: DUF1385 domain-containing protein [Coriobacteriales bacterium]|jgi:uncharacterized protein YqhQ|nr:DUF1385 domain-containing protein [Coriobacteriales bacterium]